MIKKLRECPLCTDNTKVYMCSVPLEVPNMAYAVQCNTCGPRGPVYQSQIEAITAWNTRNVVEEISAVAWEKLDSLTGNPSPITEIEWAQYCGKLRVIAAELIQKHEILDDPILIRARELCAEVANDNKYLDGSRDDYYLMRVAVRALKERFNDV